MNGGISLGVQLKIKKYEVEKDTEGNIIYEDRELRTKENGKEIIKIIRSPKRKKLLQEKIIKY